VDEQINSVPIEVCSIAPLRITLLQAFPTFESTSLKNYLAEAGHSLVIRNQIASSRYQFEFINHAEDRFQSLKDAKLDEYDLVIISSSSWNQLSQADRNVVLAAARGGLGVVIMIDEVFLELKDLSFQFKRARADSALIQLPHGASVAMPTAGVFVSAGIDKTIISEKAGAVVNGYSLLGRGKIGLQLLTPTFPLLLEDQRKMYAEIWITLLETISRSKSEPWNIRISSPFPWRKNEPLLFDIVTAEPPLIAFDSVTLPLQEDVLIDDLWHGTVWPRNEGWNKLVLPDGKDYFFYVSPAAQWQTLALRQQHQLNHYRAATDTPFAPDRTDRRPWLTWVWVAIFLVSATFLWLSPKLPF
jgi:hypothetical protein